MTRHRRTKSDEDAKVESIANFPASLKLHVAAMMLDEGQPDFAATAKRIVGDVARELGIVVSPAVVSPTLAEIAEVASQLGNWGVPLNEVAALLRAAVPSLPLAEPEKT